MFISELQPFQRDAYENYINVLIQTPKNEKRLIDALESLVVGSKIYDFLYLITKQKLTGGKLNEADKKMYDEHIKNYKQGYQELQTRQNFLNFDNYTTEKDRIEALTNIVKNDLGFEKQKYEKPHSKEHQTIKQSAEETKNSVQKKNATLDENLFNKDFIADAKKILKELAKDKSPYQFIQQSSSYLAQVPLFMVHDMDFNIFHPDSVLSFAESIADQNQVAGIVNPLFLAQVKAGMNYRLSNDKYSSPLSSNLCNKMSIEQLKSLSGMTQGYTDSNIIGACFSKQYCEELSQENQDIWTNDEKYVNLLRLYEATKTDKLPKSLSMQLLFQLLALGPKVKKYNKDHFKTYVAYADEKSGGQSTMAAIGSALKKMVLETHSNVDWTSFIQNIISQDHHNGNPHQLFQLYLTHFAYENNGNLTEFKKKESYYVESKHLETIEDRVRIYLSTTGLKNLKLNTKNQAELFKQISDEVNLTFLPENKDKFKIDELVEINLEIKNVSTVHCKVFEFNTLTYYRKTLQPFNTSIDLDGLESSIERNFEIKNTPSNCKIRKVFQFPELNDRVGLFIIEFIGNGRSARAVIKKGSLSLIHKSTIAGHVATIIDDNRQVCKGNNTGLWLDNKFYAAKEDGSIFINYQKQTQKYNVIMVHGDFAQLGEFTRKSEDYDFQCKFYLNEESVLVGQTCTILISPILKINGRQADLALLQNVTAVVKTVDFIDGTPTTKTFDKLKLTQDNDLTVSFQVPPNLQSINITLSTQVLNTTTKKMQDFSANNKFNINTFESKNEVHEYFLRMVKDDKYEILVLGKNGEPQQNQQETINLQHIYHGEVMTQLTTDELGKIYLGKLVNILTVSLLSKRKWRLPNTKFDYWSYPPQIDTIKGSSVEIPVAQMWDSQKPEKLDRCQVTLTRSIHGIVIEDWFKKIKVIKKQNAQSHYFLLQIDNLESGEYNLYLRGETDHHIEIKVHNGSFLNNMDNMILKKNCLQELVTSQKIVKIKQSSFLNNELQIQLADSTSDVRVHIMATNFVPSNCYNIFQQLQEMKQNQIGSSIFTFAKWTNLLLSDRELSDEYRYVFDRLNAERNLGNSLDRPSILNKRIFTRKTEMDQEVLSSGSKFQQMNEVIAPEIQQERFRSLAKSSHQPMMQNIMRDASEEMVGGYRGSRGRGGRQMYSRSSYDYNDNQQRDKRNYRVDDYITDYQNFIRDAPIIAYNLKPDADGIVRLQNPKLAQYSLVQIMVVDKNSIVTSNMSLQQVKEPQKRDLSLKKSLDQNKGLTQQRQHKCLQQGQSDFIEDITSSEIMLVDDLTKVQQILKEIRQISNQPEDQEWNKLNFIQKWSTLSNDQKNFYFGEYQSNEINFFIKKKDSVYFEQVVRTFLSNKMEKTFVDMYLLDMDEQIIKRALFKIDFLNAFEKCLLIEVLTRNQKQSVAKRIIKQMRDIEEASQQMNNRELQDKIFDLVINMNSTSKKTEHLQILSVNTTTTAAINQIQPMRAVSDEFMNVEADYENEEEDDDFCDDMDDIHADLEENTENYKQQRKNNFNQENFEQLEATKEYMETFYYNTQMKEEQQTRYYISVNSFWCDFAEFIVGGSKNKFISQNFTKCISQQEMFLCQVILNMPQITQASKHQYQADESRGVTIVAGSEVIIFKKEIKEVLVDIKHDFMVTHRYSRIDQYGYSNKSEDDEAIPSEFLANIPYECEVIMTNVSQSKTDFNLLYQIPICSMPIKKTKFMKSQQITLDSYSTKRLTFQFYFPQIGQFGHYPSNVSIGEKVTARGQYNTLNVVNRRTISQDNAVELNFDDLVQVGTTDQILTFLKEKNILSNEKGFAVHKIMHLLQVKAFWLKAISVLRDRQIYIPEVWRFSLQHLDQQTIKEWIQMNTNCLQINGYFKSSLVEISPQLTNKNFFRMLEYNPMINSRAHKVGTGNQRSNILNKTFRQTYDSFLQTMSYKTILSFEDQMVFVYYLQLQDRIPEAIKLFQSLDLEGHPDQSDADLQLQYDYLCAYFDLFGGGEDGYKVARRIVQRYDNYPVSFWKLLFLAIEDLLNDFDGEFDQMQSEYDSEYSGSEASLKERKQENMKSSKSREPLLASTAVDEKGSLTIETVNIKNVSVKYYMIDAEVLFSRAPFLKDNAEEFSYVKPCFQSIIQMLSEDATDEDLQKFIVKVFDLPAQLLHKNLVIEINAEGKQEFKTFYSNDLKIQINEAFGELKVMRGEKALGQVYVKVFQMQKNGKEKFYRDGYTDIRGKFEYSSSSGGDKDVNQFAILIQSEKYGSIIKEVNPPKVEESASVESKDNNQVVQTNSLMMQKQERMVNRHNWVQSKSKNSK